jgi:hypothetical protein
MKTAGSGGPLRLSSQRQRSLYASVRGASVATELELFPMSPELGER